MLTALLHIDLINVACLYQVIMTLHFLNDVVSDVELTWENDNYIISASWKSESTCKLINKIPVLCLLISSLPGRALRMHVQ